ncbi:4-hydroxy-2-oxo-heptane-1,7-dioate aldolase, partial [Enterobacter hormaechei]|nr:4-hydroxy-2-oxo-heptane-1,7-dioate aldolase [Enterobacter hormaechei]
IDTTLLARTAEALAARFIADKEPPVAPLSGVY